MMMMMILEISDEAEFDSMSEELQDAIQKAGIQWPESQLIGTKPVDDKKLILVNSKLKPSELEYLMNRDEFDEEGNQVAFNLGWSIVACEDEPVNQSVLLPYFNDTPILDEEGNQIGAEPVTDLTNRLQVWAGKKWTW